MNLLPAFIHHCPSDNQSRPGTEPVGDNMPDWSTTDIEAFDSTASKCEPGNTSNVYDNQTTQDINQLHLTLVCFRRVCAGGTRRTAAIDPYERSEQTLESPVLCYLPNDAYSLSHNSLSVPG